MVGVTLAVLTIALSVGFVGRLAMPGRHGLLNLIRLDPRLVPRFVLRDVELRWEVVAGLIGAVGGYYVGRSLDAFGVTSMRWVGCVIGALVLTGIAVASGVIERSRYTRKLGIHR